MGDARRDPVLRRSFAVTPVALPLLAALANPHAVAFSVSVPRAVIKMAELQIECLFTEHFSLALQGGIGAPTFDRTNAPDLTVTAWETGLQLRGYFTGGSSRGGAFAGAAGQYLRSDESRMSMTVQAVGAGAVVGYKWAWALGPFIDLNGGAGYGYYRVDSTAEGAQGDRTHSVYPFLNLNVGWAL